MLHPLFSKPVKSTFFNIFSYVITCMDNYFELVTNSSECFFLRFLLPPNGLHWYLLIQGFLTWHLILSIKFSFVSTVSGVVCKRASFVRSLTRFIDRQVKVVMETGNQPSTRHSWPLMSTLGTVGCSSSILITAHCSQVEKNKNPYFIPDLLLWENML